MGKKCCGGAPATPRRKEVGLLFLLALGFAVQVVSRTVLSMRVDGFAQLGSDGLAGYSEATPWIGNSAISATPSSMQTVLASEARRNSAWPYDCSRSDELDICGRCSGSSYCCPRSPAGSQPISELLGFPLNDVMQIGFKRVALYCSSNIS